MPRGLSKLQNDRLRAALRRIVDEHDGNQTAAGRELGVEQYWISRVISGKQGGSYDAAKRIAALMGVPVTALLDDEHLPLGRFDQQDGWADALREAKKRWPQYPQWVWRRVGSISKMPAPPMTPESLEPWASAVFRTEATSPDEE